MSKSTPTEILLAALVIVMCLAALAWVIIQPAVEAQQFNKCTSSNATYWTAATTELRIEKCEV